MTENNPPSGEDGQPAQPWATSPEPHAYPPSGAFPPPDAYAPSAFPQPTSAPQPGAWPQPGAPWPNQAPPYATGQPYYPPQQPPYASQQPGYPATPYAMPPGPRPRRTGLVILFGVLGLCLVLVVGGLLLRPGPAITSIPGGPGTAANPTSGGTAVAAASASDAVRGYLEALAAGDATTALGYAANDPEDATLLTDDVLAAGNAVAPISDIEVDPSAVARHADVTARYRLGVQEVESTYSVSQTGAGWRLDDVAGEVTVTQLRGLQISVNGIGIKTSDSITLFPGSYRLASADGRYQLSRGDFVLRSAIDRPSLDTQATLTDSGRSAIRSATQKRLSACIKENKALPSDDCGFGVDLVVRGTGKKIKAKTVRWRITSGADTLKSFKPKLDSGNPLVAKGQVKVKLRVDITATNGQRYWATAAIGPVRASLGETAIHVRFNE